MDLTAVAEALRCVTVEITRDGRVAGAGVVWAPELIVTSAHVLHRRPRVALRDAQGHRADGCVVASDRDADLALVHTPGLGPPAAHCRDEDVPVGALVVALGHPLGVRGALTRGIVHAVGAVSRGGRAWIQADLKLQPGNSGGPMADARGHLVGLNAMIVGGLAFAIPVGEVQRFVRSAGVAVP